MPAGDDANPTKVEVEQQLERMLASSVFCARPQQAKLFEFLVRSALAKKEVTEKDIRARFFPSPPYTPESTVARTTVNFIRGELLREYYATSGKEDLILVTLPPPKSQSPGHKRIKLPPGKAYTPSFAYNPVHEATRKYQLAIYHLRPKNNFEFVDAVAPLLEVIEQQPNHAAAHIGVAETMCLVTWMGIYGKDPLIIATEHADNAVSLAPDDWHVSAAFAAVMLVSCQWRLAKAAFERALILDKSKTEDYAWYQAFLLATGRTEEALPLAKARAYNRPHDAYAKAVYALFLYLVRQFDEARVVIKDALLLDHNCWFAYVARALVELASDDAPLAFWSLQDVQRSLRLDHDDFVFPGLAAIAISVAKNLTPDEYQHLVLKACKMIGDEPTPPYFQLVLTCIATGQTQGALDALDRAWLEFEAPTLFVHLLPLLDPLRDHEQFQALVNRRLQVPVPKPDPESDGRDDT